MELQVALVDVLHAIGIKPDNIIGHSLGENGCAYADGCLTLEESVLASYARGVASKEVKTVKGMMAAIGKSFIVKRYIILDILSTLLIMVFKFQEKGTRKLKIHYRKELKLLVTIRKITAL